MDVCIYGGFYFVSNPNRGRRYRPGYFHYSLYKAKSTPASPGIRNTGDTIKIETAIYVYINIYICMHVHAYVYVYIYIYTHICVYMLVCIYRYMYVCACIRQSAHTAHLYLDLTSASKDIDTGIYHESRAEHFWRALRRLARRLKYWALYNNYSTTVSFRAPCKAPKGSQ